jgi:hypothetical protein
MRGMSGVGVMLGGGKAGGEGGGERGGGEMGVEDGICQVAARISTLRVLGASS